MGTPANASATLVLLRHGLTAVTGSVLAGRAPGIDLDDRGRRQAEDTARRLAGLHLDAIVTSPLERCRQTAEPLAAALGLDPVVDERFSECDYGTWTGRTLEELKDEPEWPVVQQHPSAARFPGGESLAQVSARAVEAVRDWNARLTAASGTGRPRYLVCAHGDVIKAVAADALGMHLDLFQRIQVDPCSVTAVRYTAARPFLLRLNDVGATADGLAPPPQEGAQEEGGDAVVGGGAGAARL
ncbi:MSMEG_4193 family putative phosphomutase [Nocardiopsis sp. RSe5-2]|uniref:MSMEG_4193 family putative phosphomutase n=1 Tax=Nocardiopsis endophytica TaxID=3018445 RepID=A0ABT4U2Z8_9ACTN|nr:histidine phosphatase family protein [Nocardiopsis endophytica]MDA2811327.1 MSMEG_4193 family putative phosphomutase [Nocardiopsis endophytica]